MNKKKHQRTGEKKKHKQAQARRARRRRKQALKAFWMVLIVVLVGAGIYFGYQFFKQQNEALAGDQVEQLRAEHMPACTPRYPNSTPPTSGCHQPNTAPWVGISDEPIADELQVHNLEHGGIMVQYRPSVVPGLTEDYIEDLKFYMEELQQDRRYCKVILAPYPNMDPDIALTAWGWIQYLEDFDPDAIKKFIDDHIEKGPEGNIPCVPARR